MKKATEKDLIDQLLVWGMREGVVTLADADLVSLYEEDNGEWVWECSSCTGADWRPVGRPTPTQLENIEDEAKEHARRKHGQKVRKYFNDGENEEIQ